MNLLLGLPIHFACCILRSIFWIGFWKFTQQCVSKWDNMTSPHHGRSQLDPENEMAAFALVFYPSCPGGPEWPNPQIPAQPSWWHLMWRLQCQMRPWKQQATSVLTRLAIPSQVSCSRVPAVQRLEGLPIWFPRNGKSQGARRPKAKLNAIRHN